MSISGSNPFPNGVPRYCFSIVIIDNDKPGGHLLEDGFNTDDLRVIEDVMDKIKQKLRKSETTFETVTTGKQRNLPETDGM